MDDESIEANMVNGKAPLAAVRGLPPERLSPCPAEPTAAEGALSVSTLVEQYRREIPAYAHGEPSDRRESEESYVALAFERFWQATVRRQVVYRTLAGALGYLPASLNGTILDTLRAYAQPREVPLLEQGAPGEPYCEDHPTSLELLEILQSMLTSEREQRPAYLLYHCNLKPKEIVRFCQEEWTDVQEIYRLRCNILERVLRQTDQLRWWFNLQEQM